MNKKLSKFGLVLMSVLNCLYVVFLNGASKPNPITSESPVTEDTRYIIIAPMILIVICVVGLFIKEKNADIYRNISKLFTGLRVVAGEFGAFWLSFYEVWRKSGDVTPLNLFTETDTASLLLLLSVILLLFSLPLMGHTGVLLCFEYGLEKENRMKNLHRYKIFFVCLSIIALVGILTAGGVLYSQALH